MTATDSTFDPYANWLGIPRREQPANHYRLLGLRVMESDREVIASAADARMAQLKSYQAGRHQALSQRLLNEVAAARLCLLDAARKEAYDRELAAELDRRRLAQVPVESLLPPALESEIPRADAVVGAGQWRTIAGNLLRVKIPVRRWAWRLWGAGIVLLLAIYLLLLMQAMSKRKVTRQAPTPPPASAR